MVPEQVLNRLGFVADSTGVSAPPTRAHVSAWAARGTSGRPRPLRSTAQHNGVWVGRHCAAHAPSRVSDSQWCQLQQRCCHQQAMLTSGGVDEGQDFLRPCHLLREVDFGVEELQVPQEQVAGDGRLGGPEALHGMVGHGVACGSRGVRSETLRACQGCCHWKPSSSVCLCLQKASFQGGCLWFQLGETLLHAHQSCCSHQTGWRGRRRH